MPKLPVVTAIDDNYVYPLLVCVFSGSRNASQPPRWIVGHDPVLLSSESQSLIASVAALLGVDVEFMSLEIEGSFHGNGHITATAFARLPLVDRLDDFAWVDVDTLLLPGWDELLDASAFAATGAIVQAHAEGVAPGWERRAVPNQAYARAGMRYFNSGVVRLSGERWRAQGFDVLWPQVLARYAELGFDWSDQCVLNYLLAGQQADLPHRFNCHPAKRESVSADVRIIHFHGSGKPWKFSEAGSHFRLARERAGWEKYWATERALLDELDRLSPDLAGAAREIRQQLTQGTYRDLTKLERFRLRVSRRLARLRAQTRTGVG